MKKTINPIPVFIDHERFLKFITVDEKTNCWNWSGSKMKSGYGKFGISKGGWLLAHRVSFSIFKEEKLQENLVIDHICRNRSCVNPDHIHQVDIKTNTTENSKSVSALNKLKTHCNNGHEFTSKNTVKKKSGKECRICSNNYTKASAKKRRLKNRELGITGIRKPCRYGHQPTPENIKTRSGIEVCYPCYLRRAKEYYERKKIKLHVK